MITTVKALNVQTFKQPWLTRVKEAVDNAVSFTWEGCHKIYICLDQESHKVQKSYGYDMTMVTDKEAAVAALFAIWTASCPLRFICTIADGDQFVDVIGQGAYEDE